MTNEPEERLSLGEAAYRRLRTDIITCKLVPSQRLTEKELAISTGFGVSPLRDALTRLDHEGLIRTLPRKGYQVAPITPKSIDDLFVVWGIIGPELVRLGVARASDEQIAAAAQGVRALQEQSQEAPGADSALRFNETADRTMALLAAATDNGYLVEFYERLSGAIARVWALILAADPKAPFEQLFEDPAHWMLEVLQHRNADDAAEAARRYIRRMHEQVLRTVVRWPSIMTSEVVVPISQQASAEAPPNPSSRATTQRTPVKRSAAARKSQSSSGR